MSLGRPRHRTFPSATGADATSGRDLIYCLVTPRSRGWVERSNSLGRAGSSHGLATPDRATPPSATGGGRYIPDEPCYSLVSECTGKVARDHLSGLPPATEDIMLTGRPRLSSHA